MKIAIRTDASTEIGSGHVMRCLTLAKVLKRQNIEAVFICREHQGNLIEYIADQGFVTFTLPILNKSVRDYNNINSSSLYHAHWLGCTQEQDAEQCKPILESIMPTWLIVDHYAIDKTWQFLLNMTYEKLMVIDDLADRQHQCELLLDQTYGREPSDYQNLVPEKCQMLLGSVYALLRPEFAEWRDYSLKRRIKPEFKQLMITMGGFDSDNVTSELLTKIRNIQLPHDIEITVVMGVHAPHLNGIIFQAKSMPYNTQVVVNVSNMAERMANSDLAIGAAGATTWERCCLGLPCIQLIIAENQTKIFQELDSIRAIKTLKNIDNLLKKIGDAQSKSNKLSLVSSSLTEGKGANIVVEYLCSNHSEEKLLLLKPASEGDCDFIYGLQTKRTREFFRNKSLPSIYEHINWYDGILKSQSSQIFILTVADDKIGMLRLDDIENKVVEISIIISSKFSGQGLAKKSLRLLEKILLHKTLKAVVHRENIASKNVFKSLAFKFDKQSGVFEEYLKNV